MQQVEFFGREVCREVFGELFGEDETKAGIEFPAKRPEIKRWKSGGQLGVIFKRR